VCKFVLPPGDNPIAVNKYIISYLSKIYIKTLKLPLHVSILRSSSGSTYCSRKIICCHITDKYNDILAILTCNFSKEQYVLPEDDLRIETCRDILIVLM